MYGINFYSAYGNITLDWLGGTNVAFVVAVIIRLLVGAGWAGMLQKAGDKPWKAFIPVYAPYKIWRLIYDDFSFAAIFATSAVCAFVAASVPETNALVVGLNVANFIMWWVLSLISTQVFTMPAILAIVMAIIPWAGTLIIGWAPSLRYKQPWVADLDAQNGKKKKSKKRKK